MWSQDALRGGGGARRRAGQFHVPTWRGCGAQIVGHMLFGVSLRGRCGIRSPFGRWTLSKAAWRPPRGWASLRQVKARVAQRLCSREHEGVLPAAALAPARQPRPLHSTRRACFSGGGGGAAGEAGDRGREAAAGRSLEPCSLCRRRAGGSPRPALFVDEKCLCNPHAS